jgi:hypothetical protein
MGTVSYVHSVKYLLRVSQQVDPTDWAFFLCSVCAHFYTTVAVENVTTGIKGLHIISEILQANWTLRNRQFDPAASLS